MLAGLHAGASTAVAQDLHAWFVDKFVGAVGDAANLDVVAMEAEFRDRATKRHGLKADVVEALIKAQKDRLGGAA